MSFGLSPREHLEILIEERTQFWQDKTSIRKGINCCVWANHLPEIVFAAHASTSPAKVYACATESAYRAHLTGLHSDLGIIRDLCDFAKHGPYLHRRGVQVDRTGQQTTRQLNAAAAASALVYVHEDVDRLVVTLKDGTQRWTDHLIADAVNFWEKEFETHSL